MAVEFAGDVQVLSYEEKLRKMKRIITAKEEDIARRDGMIKDRDIEIEELKTKVSNQKEEIRDLLEKCKILRRDKTQLNNLMKRAEN